MTAQTRLILQVEYCTAERPSNSLRGSAQQYVQAVADFREKCKCILWEYNVRVLGNRSVCLPRVAPAIME